MIEPLTPAECDLRDFAFMPLHVVRLRDSGIAIEATAEEFRAAVMLWCASWHQVPAASLPDNDRALAALAGYGRDIAGWQSVSKGAMRGWERAVDGRMYHRVVAEVANDAWRRKLAQRERTTAARKAYLAKHKSSDTQKLKPVTERVTEDLTESKGQGQGQGYTEPPIGGAGGGESEKPKREAAKEADIPIELQAQDGFMGEWRAFLENRKAKRARATPRAQELLLARLSERPGRAVEALRECIVRNWTGFKWEWIDRDGSSPPVIAAQPTRRNRSFDEIEADARRQRP